MLGDFAANLTRRCVPFAGHFLEQGQFNIPEAKFSEAEVHRQVPAPEQHLPTTANDCWSNVGSQQAQVLC